MDAWQAYINEENSDLESATGGPPDVAVFIDLENIAMSLQRFAKVIVSSEHLVKKARRYGPIAQMRAYGPFEEAFYAPLGDACQREGIELYNCPHKHTGQSTVDMRLAADMWATAEDKPSVGTFVLMSGDQDFIPFVERLKRLGKRVIVMGVPGMMSRDLIKVADAYEPLDTQAAFTVDAQLLQELIVQIDEVIQALPRSKGPTFRVIAEAVSASFSDRIPAEQVQFVLARLVAQDILVQRIRKDNKRDRRETVLNRSSPLVLSILTQARQQTE